MPTAISMMHEDRSSLFTEAERSKHQETERGLIAQAKYGNINSLLSFWAEKRKRFLLRAFERSPFSKGMA